VPGSRLPREKPRLIAGPSNLCRLAAGGKRIRTVSPAMKTGVVRRRGPHKLRSFGQRRRHQCKEGPEVRIHFPPPASQVRTRFPTYIRGRSRLGAEAQLCAGHPAQPSIFCVLRDRPPIPQRTSSLALLKFEYDSLIIRKRHKSNVACRRCLVVRAA
jgi:hypothetical protein